MNWKSRGKWIVVWGMMAALTGAGLILQAQTAFRQSGTGTAGAGQTPSQGKTEAKTDTGPEVKPEAKAETKITPQQAKELFRSVDDILRFSSEDSKLAIHSKVKRRLTNRQAVEQYILDRLKNDEDAKRMQRGEIVLKKFGLLDRDFQLGPFMVSLLKEQIAGYYDDKTKTVNLLDWIEPEQQKSVLAHELTHALQDQRVNLEKWQLKSETGLSHNVTEDNRHLQVDEEDTTRDAVLEGQAMAVFLDWELKPSGRTMLTAGDEVREQMDEMGDASGSPVLTRAPLLLQQELLFPYKKGLSFEFALLKARGVDAAFAGVLDHPPATTYEILNPRAYQDGQKIPLLRMPDVHSLLDPEYEPYDVGVMGQLDVSILTELFGGPVLSGALTPQWNGGLYYAAQKKSAHTPEEKGSTASLSLLYFSDWKTEGAARAFAEMYAKEISRKYSGVLPDSTDDAAQGEKTFQTSEGPVLIAVNGTQVFISESFDQTTARKLQLLLTGAQQSEQLRIAAAPAPPQQELASALRQFLGGCGMMKVALAH
jgi:hypothetical protein